MIKPKFTKSDLRQMFQNKFNAIDQAIITRLQYIGENFVNNARANANFMDITGNLRSSIGYVVLKDGKKRANSGFDKVKGGIKGNYDGQNYIKELISQHQEGYVLIVVAGMDYAAAVESKGKDVLTASSIIAKKDLRKAFKQYKE